MVNIQYWQLVVYISHLLHFDYWIEYDELAVLHLKHEPAYNVLPIGHDKHYTLFYLLYTVEQVKQPYDEHDIHDVLLTAVLPMFNK